jgi:hypothetical protein
MKLLPFLALTASGIVCVMAADKKPDAATPGLKVHPKVFSMVDCWISDSKAPVVTEINLDAVQANGNEFDESVIVQEDGWTRCPAADGQGFQRYRVLEVKGNRYKVEYQSNGGGTFTSASVIECTVESRAIRRSGKPATIRVLRVFSCDAK